MSEVMVGPKTLEFSPVNELALLVPFELPVDTSESFDVFFASTEVFPPDTTPDTWPPTALPDFEDPDWVPVLRLCPSWTLFADALLTSARASPAAIDVPDATSAATRTDLKSFDIRLPPSSDRFDGSAVHQPPVLLLLLV